MLINDYANDYNDNSSGGGGGGDGGGDSGGEEERRGVPIVGVLERAFKGLKRHHLSTPLLPAHLAS